MERSRILELVGAFLLGGGGVAVAYELMSGGGAPSEPGDADAVAQAAADAEGGDAPPVYVDGDARDSGAPSEPTAPEDRPPHLVPNAAGTYEAFPPIFEPPKPMDAEAEADFPRHGLVTSLGALVRQRADLESPILGLLRGGTRVRVDGERTFGGGCKEGWNKVYPHGWICRKAGMKVADEPPDDGVVALPEPKIDSRLPYAYWRVNEEMTPFFHRLPSFEEQDRADEAGKTWYAEHKREPMPTHPAQRPDEVPAVVREYMNAGYYVTKAGEEIKSQRRFLRTTRGAYARKYQLGVKEAPDFEGLLLPGGVEDLPIYFIRRELALQEREAEGSDVLVKTDVIPPRLSTHPFKRLLHMGPKSYFEDEEGRLMRSYAVGKAYKLKRPPGVAEHEHWIHVDLSEQTLVAYDGDVPIFTTLVSTGKEPGMTPIGVHRVQIKHIATSMRDQPQEDEAYSIDDVPWTQYFHGSVAIHGAFWHAGFGLVRSHGCINLSPSDARWLFGFTDPPLPDKWHARAPLLRGEKGSPIVVTE